MSVPPPDPATVANIGLVLGIAHITKDAVADIVKRLFGPSADKAGDRLAGFFFDRRAERVTTTLAEGVKMLTDVGLKPQAVRGLIRFRGHLPKGGYDVQNGIKAGRETSANGIRRPAPHCNTSAGSRSCRSPPRCTKTSGRGSSPPRTPARTLSLARTLLPPASASSSPGRPTQSRPPPDVDSHATPAALASLGTPSVPDGS